MPWPPSHLVAEFITISAPSSMGRLRNGVAKVLSIRSGIFASCAICATAGMSSTSSPGLPMVSPITTRLVIGETIGNPGLEVLDIPAVAQIAHEAKIPLLIDNTFATPFLSRPIELGADIVMNSATKWLGGHGIAIGGVIIDGGRFDWHASGKFPQLTEPYAGYHGIVFDEQFGQAAFIMRARTEGLRDFGACLSPTNAFQLLQGIETLGVRMERHMSNTLAVLEALAANKAVDWVLHPALESHPDHALARKLLPRGAGSIVSFGIKGGRPAGKKFIESLKLISHL